MKTQEEKRQEAQARQAAHDKLSLEQKLAKAVERGGTKEAVRLHQAIARRDQPKPEVGEAAKAARDERRRKNIGAQR